MGVQGPGYYVEPEVLARASQLMAAIVADQDQRELTDLDGASDIYGHAGFAAGFTTFCDRWSVGLDALCDRARWMGHGLGSAAETYRATDADAAGRLNQTVDPGLASQRSLFRDMQPGM